MRTTLSLFHEIEPNVNYSLNNLSKIIDRKFGLIKTFQQKSQYFDEPKFWFFSALINDKFLPHDGSDFYNFSSGLSFFSKETAVFKCLAESIERYCNFVFLKSSVSFTGSLKQLKQNGYKALNPDFFARFSPKQLENKSFKHFKITENSKLRWTSCNSLTKEESVMVPSQFIYLSYKTLPNEPVLYPSISTGVAGGASLSGALVRGIYEIIERDAFMIYYLNKLPAAKFQLNDIKDERVSKLLQIARRYKMKIVSFDIASDIGVPVIMSIIMERTGIGTAISVGLKSDLNVAEALVGSITEAFHTRGWIREEYEKNPRMVKKSDFIKNSDMLTRGLLWYPADAIKHLDFWLKSPRKAKVRLTNSVLTTGEQLKLVLNKLNRLGYTVYWKNLMVSKLAKLQFFVVKTIIPQLQPLYLNENYPLLGGKRLYEVPEKLGFKRKQEKELNTYPHPFL